MLVRAHAEVLERLARVLGTTKDQGVGASGGTKGELVESESLAAGRRDAGPGGSSEAEGCNGDLGDSQETVVVGDSADNDDGALVVLGEVGSNAAQRDGGAVDLGHKEASENNLVEAGVGAAWKGKGAGVNVRNRPHVNPQEGARGDARAGRKGVLTRQEAVELHQELEIDIVTLGRLAVRPLDVVAVQINTCKAKHTLSASSPTHAQCGQRRYQR